MSLPRVLCIVGPTAVGKSAVAEHVSLELGGEVVSVDSMQVYRGMDIGTAKTPLAERICPLHMVDIADISTPYSVSMFQKSARACIDALGKAGKPAVLCGGTGLYLDAVIDEMHFPSGDQSSSQRVAYERIAMQEGPDQLHKLLASRDPMSASEIHPHNVKRVVRALELLDAGVSYAENHRGLKRREPHYDADIWALTMPREELYRRIEARVDTMVERGLFEEVRRLDALGLRNTATASQAIGYKEMLSAIYGEISLAEAIALIKRNTRRYAKRQLSWIARDGRARLLDISEMNQDEQVGLIVKDWRGHYS